jgi:DNA (cytosine-5)-methyltransferase 1
MLRVISEARPTWVVGENVTGIISMELDTVLSDLGAIGYATRPFVIPACGVDAPHRRYRVWIVAHAGHGSRWQGRIQRPGEDSDTLGKGTPSYLEQSSQDVADAKDSNGRRTNEQNYEWWRDSKVRGSSKQIGRVQYWLPEPGFCRVAHGVPQRVHRLKALGNAIVPQVAYPILKAIYDIDNALVTNDESN